MQIITGMHRSGTSVVAKLLSAAGADLGNPDTYYPTDKWNPKGYYEQQEIFDFNRFLLHGPWGLLAYFRLPSHESLMKRASEHEKQIGELAAKYDGKVVKDPRFCLLLKAWRENGARVERVLVCMREPVLVAESIKSRNKLPRFFSYNLWHEHHLRLFQNLENVPVWFVDYQRLLDQETFLLEARGLLNFCGIELTNGEIKDLQERCVYEELNRSMKIVQKLDKVRYPEKIRDLWDILKNKHRAQFQPSSRSSLFI